MALSARRQAAEAVTLSLDPDIVPPPLIADSARIARKPAFIQLFILTRMLHPRAFLYVVPPTLAFLAALLDGICMFLLIPLLHSILPGQPPLELQGSGFIGWLIPTKLLTSSSTPLLGACVIGGLTLKAILQFTNSTILSRHVKAVIRKLQTLLFGRVLRFGKLYFDQSNAGKIHGILMHFSSEVGLIAYRVQDLLLYALHLVIYTVVLASISWKVTLVVTTIFPVAYLAVGWLSKRIRRASSSAAMLVNEADEKIFNILACIPLIKHYCQEAQELLRFKDLANRISVMNSEIDRRNYLSTLLQEVIVLTSLLVILMVVPSIFFKNGLVNASQLLVYFFVAKRTLTCFTSANSQLIDLERYKGQLEQIFGLLDDREKIYVESGRKVFVGLTTAIEINDLHFRYVPNVPVLEGASFRVPQGKMTAIVGHTGSGKTTILNLLQRLYDCPPNTILLDGVDIREFSVESLLNQMSIVTQDILLFNSSIKSNLLYGLKRHVLDEELVRCLRDVELFDLVESLPQKWDTEIGDRGVKLSGGEKQRLSLARALLKDSTILILDEATSALDAKVERAIQEAIAKLSKNRATIVVAHRLSTIRRADQIVVLEEGRVVELGTFDELIFKKGKFFNYWDHQRLV